MMTIKEFKLWHKKHLDAIPADDPANNLKGFWDINSEIIVYCNAKDVNKDKYFINYYNKLRKQFEDNRNTYCNNDYSFDDEFSMTQNWYG